MIYRYINYLEFLEDWLSSRPKGGRGIKGQIASSLGISTVLVSQIFNGTRSIQAEYVYDLANFMGLDAKEIDYFLLLVQYEQAGKKQFKDFLLSKIQKIQNDSKRAINQVAKDIELSNLAKAEFYSDWSYSAVRLLSDIKEYNKVKDFSKSLKISEEKVEKIIDFLISHNLCFKKNNEIGMKAQNTHLEETSPWIFSRQLQWRHKAIEKMNNHNRDNLFYTGPMVLSKNDAIKIRELLLLAIKEVLAVVKPSKSEQLMCLNIDWFHVLEEGN